MSVSYVKSFFMVYIVQKLYDVIEIVKRLAYTHHNNIAYTLADVFLCKNNLIKYFTRR